MAEDQRFDWGAIFRVSGIIIGVCAVYALIVPLAGAFIDGNGTKWTTGTVAGNEIYQWIFWALAWALTIWQASWMIRHVHDRIIDDMLVVAVIVAIVLVVVKALVSIIYAATDASGSPMLPITGIDAGGAVVTGFVALIGARINRY